ncbi:MAG: CoA-binding protein [Acidobacteriota bacterium]
MPETTRQAIDGFLAQKRIALVGASRNPRDFNTCLFRDLRKQGYDVVPVNPAAKEIEGVPCYDSVQAIQPPVEGVLVMTRPDTAATVVNDCRQAGIKRIWLYRATGKGAVSDAAIDFCNRNGISVVPGYCPYMFLPQTQWVHRLHGAFLKITRKYPA